jgi:hypothetical protein
LFLILILGFVAAGGTMGGFILPMSQPSQAAPVVSSNPFTGKPANLSAPPRPGAAS